MNCFQVIRDFFLQLRKDNMRMISIILNCVILLLYGCKGEELITDPPVITNEEEQEMELLWQIPLTEDTVFKFSIAPLIYNEGILFSAQRPAVPGPTFIKFADSVFGNLIWQTDAAFELDCNNPAYVSGNGSYIYDHYYVTLCNSDPRVVDMNDGSVFWHYECPDGSISNITHFNNILFHSHLTGSNPYFSGSIVMTDIYNGIWDTIYTIDMVDDWSVGIYPPAAVIDVNNDTLLYFQNRQYRTSPYEGKIDLYAYNMTADTLLWVVTDIDPIGNSAIYPPLVYQGKVYFKGSYSVFCLDAQTGEILWDRIFTGFGEDLIYGNLMIAENNLIVKTSYESIYALDVLTGNIIWQNLDAGATPSDMTYHNGIIYYGSAGDAKLHAIDAITGVQLWEIITPNNLAEACLCYPVAIDPVLNRLYTTDGFYLMCFRIND